jgi:hypothetical protein
VLLRARHQRPSRCHAAKESNDITPLHLIAPERGSKDPEALDRGCSSLSRILRSSMWMSGTTRRRYAVDLGGSSNGLAIDLPWVIETPQPNGRFTRRQPFGNS